MSELNSITPMRATGKPPLAAARAASRSTTVTSAHNCAPDLLALSELGSGAPVSGQWVQRPPDWTVAFQFDELSIRNSTFGLSGPAVWLSRCAASGLMATTFSATWPVEASPPCWWSA